MAPSLQGVLTLPRNTRGRDIVVGDIHGMFSLLREALRAIDFNARCDRLIAPGDLVDRGPANEDFAHWLNRSWFFSSMGNHDLSIAFYEHPDFSMHCHPRDHAWFWLLDDAKRKSFASDLAQLPIAIEIETDDEPIVIVHAGFPRGEYHWPTFRNQLNAGQQEAIAAATWDRKGFKDHDATPITGCRHVIHGHNVIKEPQQHTLRFGNRYYIDTGAVLRHTHQGEPDANKFDLTLIDAHHPEVPLFGPQHRPAVRTQQADRAISSDNIQRR